MKRNEEIIKEELGSPHSRRMIDEPKTPYIGPEILTDSEGASVASSCSWDEEDDFRKQRARHYRNDGAAMRNPMKE